MIVGQTIMVMGGNPYYSPAFSRGGESALFSLEVIHEIGTSPSLAVSVEHKNYEDTAWTAAGAFTAITAIGVYSKDLSDLKEELRFNFIPTGTDGDAFHILLAQPAWRPY